MPMAGRMHVAEAEPVAVVTAAPGVPTTVARRVDVTEPLREPVRPSRFRLTRHPSAGATSARR